MNVQCYVRLQLSSMPMEEARSRVIDVHLDMLERHTLVQMEECVAFQGSLV
jgi:hypothetical protein